MGCGLDVRLEGDRREALQRDLIAEPGGAEKLIERDLLGSVRTGDGERHECQRDCRTSHHEATKGTGIVKSALVSRPSMVSTFTRSSARLPFPRAAPPR